MAVEGKVFCDAVRVVMREWPVLKLAVQQGFGGIDSQEKGNWMIDVVIQVLVENNDVEDYELEDYMAEILYNEFDTILEDGSIGKVAKKLCSLQKLWRKGKFAELQTEITSAPKSGKIQIQEGQVAGNEDVEEVDDSHQLQNSKIKSSDVTEQFSRMELSQSALGENSKPSNCTAATSTCAPSPLDIVHCDHQEDGGAEEEWEVVRRTRRKR